MRGNPFSEGATLSPQAGMMNQDDENGTRYTVVINDEEQYSIWPADRGLPDGWHEAGTSGTRQACLDYIAEVWIDMRPASLRRAMEQNSNASPKSR